MRMHTYVFRDHHHASAHCTPLQIKRRLTNNRNALENSLNNLKHVKSTIIFMIIYFIIIRCFARPEPAFWNWMELVIVPALASNCMWTKHQNHQPSRLCTLFMLNLNYICFLEFLFCRKLDFEFEMHIIYITQHNYFCTTFVFTSYFTHAILIIFWQQ